MAVGGCWCTFVVLLSVGMSAVTADSGFVRQPYHDSDKIIFPGDLPYPFVQLDSAAVQELQMNHQHAIEVILGVAMRLKRLIDGEETIVNRNFMVSPISVTAALGELLVGSRGSLREHLIDVLQIRHLENRSAAPYDFLKFHEELGSLLTYLDSHPGQDRYTLKSASVVFLDNAVKNSINVDYKYVLETIYKCDILAVNFSGDPGGSMRAVNGWVSDNTAGLIPEVLSSPPPAYTVAIMANAVYFKGRWEVPFNSRYTMESSFRVSPRKTIKVQMMNGDMELKYAEDPELGIRLIILPYKDYQAAMYLMQPLDNNQLDLEPILTKMNVQNVARLINKTELIMVSVSLPRMKLRSSLSLRKPLLHYKEIYLGSVTTAPPPPSYPFSQEGPSDQEAGKPGEIGGSSRPFGGGQGVGQVPLSVGSLPPTGSSQSGSNAYPAPSPSRPIGPPGYPAPSPSRPIGPPGYPAPSPSKPFEPSGYPEPSPTGPNGYPSQGFPESEKRPGGSFSPRPEPITTTRPPFHPNASVHVEYNTEDQYPGGLPVIVIGPPKNTTTERPRIPLNHARPKNRGQNRRARQGLKKPCESQMRFGEQYGANNNLEYMSQVRRTPQRAQQESQTGQIAGQLGEAASQLGEQANHYGEMAGQLGQHAGSFGNAAGQIGTSSQNIGSNVQQIGSNPTTLPQNTGQIAQNLGQIGQGLGQIGQTSGQVGQMAGQGALEASQMVQQGVSQQQQQQQPMKLSDRFGDSVGNDFNMTGASSDPRFKIDDIIHQMFLEINEMGTEAAAVTITTVDYMGGGARFIADRPFVFFIRHEPTSASLFWGTIVNPKE